MAGRYDSSEIQKIKDRAANENEAFFELLRRGLEFETYKRIKEASPEIPDSLAEKIARQRMEKLEKEKNDKTL